MTTITSIVIPAAAATIIITIIATTITITTITIITIIIPLVGKLELIFATLW